MTNSVITKEGKEVQNYWYNYDSGKYDLRGMPETDEDAIHYIPIGEFGAARNLYGLYRETGLSISEAMLKTLEAFCGVKHTEAANE